MKGIEPSYSAWKAAALPLSYTRFCSLLLVPQSIASTTQEIPRASRPNPSTNSKSQSNRIHLTEPMGGVGFEPT